MYRLKQSISEKKKQTKQIKSFTEGNEMNVALYIILTVA